MTFELNNNWLRQNFEALSRVRGYPVQDRFFVFWRWCRPFDISTHECEAARRRPWSSVWWTASRVGVETSWCPVPELVWVRVRGWQTGGVASAVLQMSVTLKKELSLEVKLSIYQSIYIPTLPDIPELWVLTEEWDCKMSFLWSVSSLTLRDRVRGWVNSSSGQEAIWTTQVGGFSVGGGLRADPWILEGLRLLTGLGGSWGESAAPMTWPWISSRNCNDVKLCLPFPTLYNTDLSLTPHSVFCNTTLS